MDRAVLTSIRNHYRIIYVDRLNSLRLTLFGVDLKEIHLGNFLCLLDFYVAILKKLPSIRQVALPWGKRL